VLETPTPLKVSIKSEAASTEAPAESDNGQFYPDQNRVSKPPPEKRAAVSKPVLLLAAVLLIGGAVFAGIQLLGGSDNKARVTTPVELTAQQQPVVPAEPVDPELEISQAGLQSLGRLVKVWMIQFGSGFDPSQVTLERMRLDLQLGAEELVDGWGNDYRYQVESKRYLIQSAGSDRQFDTDDDLEQAFGGE